MILLCAAAWGAGLLLVVREQDGAFNKAIPRAQITDAAGKTANLNMIDQGTAPDKVAGDAVWTGETRDAGAGPYTLLISDGGDVLRWTGTFAGAGDEPSVVTLQVAPGGAISELPIGTLPYTEPTGLPLAAAPLSAEQTVSGTASATPTTPTSTTSAFTVSTAAASVTRILAWSGLVAALAWLATGSRRFDLVAVEARPGRRLPLPGRGVVRVRGDAARLVRGLAGPCRVIVVGDVGTAEVPDGTVFDVGAGRARIEEVVAAARQLERQGPPLVIVLTTPLDTPPEGALERLAAALPRGVVAYAFTGEDATMEVGDDGALRPI